MPGAGSSRMGVQTPQQMAETIANQHMEREDYQHVNVEIALNEDAERRYMLRSQEVPGAPATDGTVEDRRGPYNYYQKYHMRGLLIEDLKQISRVEEKYEEWADQILNGHYSYWTVPSSDGVIPWRM